MDVVACIDKLEESDPLKKKAKEAIARTKRAVALYGRELALSFNGGKDSTVVFHLLRAAMHLHSTSTSSSTTSTTGEEEVFRSLCTFFFPQDDDFEDITHFVEDAAREYHLKEVTYFHVDFKQGLETLIRDKGIKAMVLGTRFGDPNAKGQEYFCPSSEGWPPFMRVNPILDWTYEDVWAFLRKCNLKYCRLYDEGYTSIGNTTDTVPNPHLYVQGTGITNMIQYQPAYALEDHTTERAGRKEKERK